jgi:hypothetical protein
VNLRSNLERIYEVEEGLKYFNGVLNNTSRAKIEGKLGLLKNQRDHLESEIKSYERFLDRNVRGGTSYEGYKNSMFYQKLEHLKQKNHEINRDVVEANRVYDEQYNFNVQWSRAKALIDNLEQQKQHLKNQIERDEQIKQAKLEEQQERVRQEEQARQARIQIGLNRMQLKNETDEFFTEKFRNYTETLQNSRKELKDLYKSSLLQQELDEFTSLIDNTEINQDTSDIWPKTLTPGMTNLKHSKESPYNILSRKTGPSVKDLRYLMGSITSPSLNDCLSNLPKAAKHSVFMRSKDPNSKFFKNLSMMDLLPYSESGQYLAKSVDVSKAFPSKASSPAIYVENKSRMVQSRSSQFSGPMSCKSPEKWSSKNDTTLGSGIIGKNSLRLSQRESFLLGFKPPAQGPALQRDGTIFRDQNFGKFDDMFSKNGHPDQSELPPISSMSPSMYPGSPKIGGFDPPSKKSTFIKYEGYSYQSTRNSIPQVDIKERLMRPLQKDSQIYGDRSETSMSKGPT